MITLDLKQVDMASVKLTDVDFKDYPDFVDAYICEASFMSGEPLNDKQCEQLKEMIDITKIAMDWLY